MNPASPTSAITATFGSHEEALLTKLTISPLPQPQQVKQGTNKDAHHVEASSTTRGTRPSLSARFMECYEHGMSNAVVVPGIADDPPPPHAAAAHLVERREFVRVVVHAVLHAVHDVEHRTCDPDAASALASRAWDDHHTRGFVVLRGQSSLLDWRGALRDTVTAVSDASVGSMLPSFRYGPIPSWEEYEPYKTLSTLRFDAQAHHLISTLKEILGVPPHSDLAKIHESFGPLASSPPRRDRYTFENNQRTPVHLRYYSHPALDKFLLCYDRFLVQEIAPQYPHDRFLVVQDRPTFRCQLPHNGSVGLPHADRLFGHREVEVNYWLPLTRAYGTNSIYVESEPGAGDYRNVRTDVGEYVRFFGSRCIHYDRPNETGDTRMSIDFRVIPYRWYRKCRHEMDSSCNASMKFVVGSYFKVYDRESGTFHHDEDEIESAFAAMEPSSVSVMDFAE